MSDPRDHEGLEEARTVFTGLVFDIVRLRARDTERELEFAVAADSVRVYPLDVDGAITLIDERRPGPFDDVVLRAVSGSIEAGETPAEAAERELREEIGCVAERLELFHTSMTNMKVLNRTFHFVAEGLSWQAPTPEPDEHIAPRRIARDAVDEIIWSDAIVEDPVSFALLRLMRLRGV